jgi:hypothetical protein
VIGTLITLFIILAVASVLWWVISQLPLPSPVKIVVQVVVALICLLFLWNMFAGGHTTLRLN